MSKRIPLGLFLALVLAMVCVASFSASCTRKNGKIDVEYPGGVKTQLEIKETLRINLSSEPPSLDWQKATDLTSATITGNIMEGLIQYDLRDKEMNLIPGLATKWEPQDQARKWKLTIRQGVVWSDGVPFTAQHVLDGWKRLLTRATGSEYAYFLFPIRNAQDYNAGKREWAEVGVKLTGPDEITVELEKPMGYFPYLLTHHSTYPIRIDVIEKHGEKWTEPPNLVSLGPFVLKAWQHDKQIVLERNESYFGEKPSLKNIVAYMIIEQSTAINLFNSGKLDSVHSLPSVELRKLRTRKEFRENSVMQIYYFGLNVEKPPMDKPLVRRAIAMAIDRQQIVQMLAGGQVPLSGWIPAGLLGYEAERGLSFNPEKARALLKEAGYSEKSPFPKLELRFNTNEDHQRIAENVQAQLKTNLGIDMELKNSEWKVYINTLRTDTPHVFRSGWSADYPDPDNFMSLLYSFSENNRTRWKNARFDQLVAKAAGTVDREERKKLYSDAQKILVEEDVPVIPLFSQVIQFLIAERVENYPLNMMSLYQFKGVKLK